MVISTGMTLPRMDSVWALYALQNSMMFTPCGPSAVPTGGAGVAAPACSCTLTSAAIFFLGGILQDPFDSYVVVSTNTLTDPSVRCSATWVLPWCWCCCAAGFETVAERPPQPPLLCCLGLRPSG